MMDRYSHNRIRISICNTHSLLAILHLTKTMSRSKNSHKTSSKPQLNQRSDMRHQPNKPIKTGESWIKNKAGSKQKKRKKSTERERERVELRTKLNVPTLTHRKKRHRTTANGRRKKNGKDVFQSLSNPLNPAKVRSKTKGTGRKAEERKKERKKERETHTHTLLSLSVRSRLNH